MKNQKVNGYVFITVTVIVTILVSTLTVAISGQNKSIELIQNYEKLRIIEEEISAIELELAYWFLPSKKVEFNPDEIRLK